MDISGIINAADPSGGANAADRTKFGNDYNQFLRLLTTQLQNQDPMSPMDTSEFTNQLVQFSSVEQQIKSNGLLQKLLTLNTLSLTGIGLGYVGLKVFSPGSDFVFDGTGNANLSYSMPEKATVGTLSIVNAAGDTVYTAPAKLDAGTHNFNWDGKDNAGNPLPTGPYEIRVGAQDAQKNPLAVETYVSGTVTGVETKEDGNVSVIINGKLVPVTDVRQASLPTYAYTPPADGG